jgi:hypothetical protein
MGKTTQWQRFEQSCAHGVTAGAGGPLLGEDSGPAVGGEPAKVEASAAPADAAAKKKDPVLP